MARTVKSSGCAAGLSLFFIAAGFLPAATIAQTEQQVRGWLDHELQGGSSLEQVAGVAFRFDELFYAELDAGGLERLQAKVAGRPDHPARAQLRTNERRLSSGPDVRQWVVWTVGPGQWRINQTSSFSSVPFVDRARRGKDAWMFTDEFLEIVDAASPPSGRDIAASEGIVREHLDDLLHGGLRSGGRDVSFENVATDQGNWAATQVFTLRSGASVALEFQGTWDDGIENGRGIVRSRRIADCPDPDAIGQSRVYSDWQFDDTLGRWICGRVEEHDAHGRLTEALVFRGVDPFTPDEFEKLTAIPNPTGIDPVRGPLTVRTVNDFREDPVRWESVRNGEVVDSGRIRASAPRQDRVPWRAIGWCAAVLIIAAIVAIRLRKSKI